MIVSGSGENRNTQAGFINFRLYLNNLTPKFSTYVLIVKGIAVDRNLHLVVGGAPW